MKIHAYALMVHLITCTQKHVILRTKYINKSELQLNILPTQYNYY